MLKSGVMPQSVDSFLLDLDGTIVDTRKLICTSLQKAIREVLGEEVQCDALIRYIGVSMPEITSDIAPDCASQLAESFSHHYREGPTADIFPSIDGVLHQLNDWGYSLALVTSKGRPAALTHLRDHTLEGLFSAIVTSGDVKRTKPDAEPVLLAVNRLNRDPEQCVMIGDSPADVQSGQAAGVCTVWARWGVHPDLVFQNAAARADFVLRHPEEILDIVPRS